MSWNAITQYLILMNSPSVQTCETGAIYQELYHNLDYLCRCVAGYDIMGNITTFSKSA